MPPIPTDRQVASRFEAEQVRAGLEQIRLRLLDLTSRNKLLSFRHTRSTLRIINTDLDTLYGELLSGQKLPFLHLPEPTKEEVALFGERPAAKQYAEQLGWATSYDLPFGAGRNGCLSVLHFRDDFEALVRKIGSTAKTAIEESGVNLLHLIFGFLEWRESDDSTQVRQAPLLVIPVQLLGPKAKEEDRTVKIQYAGEDLNTNLSLVEKMRRDFNIEIPLLQEEETPEQYYRRFDKILEQKRDWRISRQVSLGLLSFGKLLMYLDLDASRWPESAPLGQHPRLIDIFAKRAASELEFASEYEIDEEEKKGPIPPIVCEADSSQHSALVDASRGKNLVIEGPPGTGKSQTITNLIASFLGQGKRILFVAEKMAALDVVKRRLDQYGLGDFCLELHSHKTSKVGLLKSLDARINAQRNYGESTALAHKLGLLSHRREELTKYVNLLNAPFAAILQSPFELIWNREAVRQDLPVEILDPRGVVFEGAERWDFSAFQDRKDSVGSLQAHFLRFRDAGGSVDKALNPWSWLPPCNLDQSAQQALVATLSRLNASCERHRALLEAFDRTFTEITTDPTAWLPYTPEWLPHIPHPDSAVSPSLFEPLSDSVTRAALQDFVQRKDLLVETIDSLPNGGVGLIEGDLTQQIERDARQLASTGVADFTLKNLKQLIEVLGNAKSQCLPAGAALAELSSALDVESTFSIRCLTDLITARELLESAPLSVLHLRDQRFEFEGLIPLLLSAADQSKDLVSQQKSMANDFLVDGSVSSEELEAVASVLENTPWFKRWFSSAYKRSVGVYTTHCHASPEKKTRHQMANGLRLIAQFKTRLLEFANRKDLNTRLGNDFCGIATEWDSLIAIATWYEQLLVRLPEHQEFKNRLRTSLLRLPAARLKGILTSTSPIVPRAEELKALLESVGRLHSLLPHLSFEQNDAKIDDFLDEAAKVAAEAEALLTTVEPLNLPPETHSAKLHELVNAVHKVRQLRDSLENDGLVKDLLRGEYRGAATETRPLHLTLEFVRTIGDSPLNPTLKKWLMHANYAERRAWVQDWIADYEANLRLLTSLEQEVIAAIKVEIPFAKKTSIEALGKAISALDKCCAAHSLLPMWIDVQHAATRLRDSGLQYLVDAATQGILPLDKLRKAFDYFFYDSLIRNLFNEHPELWRLTGTSHEETRRQFCDLDKAVIELMRLDIAYKASRKRVPPGVRGTVVRETTDLALVYHEINKQKGHIPIRQLMLRAGDAIQALKPCFMMSPMSVAQFLAPGQLNFDLIVMDEASQLRPEDALGAVARGVQLVVVGDPKQLPPTSFFQRTLDDEEDDEEKTSASEGESILDIALGQYQPVRRLRWHYRSQHHSLIAFSNEEFYGGDLVVFPSAYQQHEDLGVKYVSANGVYENRRNPLEAERVVEAILEHIAIHPSDSLGVVTMNFEQRELIEELLDARLRDDTFSSTWIEARENTPEPFFIKNLENVQGDERDAIFISVTYGRDAQGNMFQRFAGVNTATGHRRLNVLITRAKKRTVVFSSLDPDLIQTTPASPYGVRALKGYLNYAKKGISSAPEISPGAEPSNEHEAAIGSVLKEHGYEVVPQVGVSGYFIDLAVRHPSKPGAFLLGIEFDGKSYHSGRSARDRDRLRQMTLVNQGWAIHRIWSTDWFKNRSAEIDRLLRRVRDLESAN